MFLFKELDQPCLDRHQSLLVDAGCVHSGLTGFIVELMKLVPGHANDLSAFPGLLELSFKAPGQLGVIEQGFPLVLGELERIRLAGLLGPLEAENNRSRIIARQVIRSGPSGASHVPAAGVSGLSSSDFMFSLQVRTFS